MDVVLSCSTFQSKSYTWLDYVPVEHSTIVTNGRTPWKPLDRIWSFSRKEGINDVPTANLGFAFSPFSSANKLGEKDILSHRWNMRCSKPTEIMRKSLSKGAVPGDNFLRAVTGMNDYSLRFPHMRGVNLHNSSSVMLIFLQGFWVIFCY